LERKVTNQTKPLLSKKFQLYQKESSRWREGERERRKKDSKLKLRKSERRKKDSKLKLRERERGERKIVN
jgi:hypothetical protein